MKEIIEFTDFMKVDIRAGTIKVCVPVEGSEKLLRLEVDFGSEIGTRQILAGIAKFYSPDELVGVQSVFVVNMAPRKIMGLESQGMLLALGLSDDARPILLSPRDIVSDGEGAR